MKNKGWTRESERHKLSAYGIRSSYEINKITRNTSVYDEWKDEVKKILYKHIHLGIEDIPADFDWQSWYKDGFTPRQTVMMWLEEQAELPEIMSSTQSYKILDKLEAEEDEENAKLEKIIKDRGYGELETRRSSIDENTEYYFKEYPMYPMLIPTDKLNEKEIEDWLKKAYIKIQRKYEENYKRGNRI